jgi:hypothetical protein
MALLRGSATGGERFWTWTLGKGFGPGWGKVLTLTWGNLMALPWGKVLDLAGESYWTSTTPLLSAGESSKSFLSVLMNTCSGVFSNDRSYRLRCV